MPQRPRLPIVLGLTTALAACGGGSSSGPSKPWQPSPEYLAANRAFDERLAAKQAEIAEEAKAKEAALADEDALFIHDEDHQWTLLVTEESVGPFTINTAFDVDAIRAIIARHPGFTVTFNKGAELGDHMINDGSTLHIDDGDGFAAGANLLALYTQSDGGDGIDHIRLTSSRLDIPGHDWHVDDTISKLDDGAVCECIDDGARCFQDHSHFAMVLGVACNDPGIFTDGQALIDQALGAVRLKYVVWKPNAFLAHP